MGCGGEEVDCGEWGGCGECIGGEGIKGQQKEVSILLYLVFVTIFDEGSTINIFWGCWMPSFVLFCLIGWCIVSRVLARMRRTEQIKFHTQRR